MSEGGNVVPFPETVLCESFEFEQAYSCGNLIEHRDMLFECTAELVWGRYPTSTEGRKRCKLVLDDGGEHVDMDFIYGGIHSRLEDQDERIAEIERKLGLRRP